MPPRVPRGFTNPTQLRRHGDFLHGVYSARNPHRAARAGCYAQVRALLSAVCSVIFSEIPPDEATRARVQRHARVRAFLEKFTKPIARRLLASRDLSAYFDFLRRLSTTLQPILSNLFRCDTAESSPVSARAEPPPPREEEEKATPRA